VVQFPKRNTEDDRKNDKYCQKNCRAQLIVGHDGKHGSENVQGKVKVHLLNVPLVDYVLQHIKHMTV